MLNAELPRLRQHNPSSKSEAQHLYAHLKWSRYVNPEVLFVKCCELPQKGRMLLQQIQLLLRSFLARVASAQLLWLWVVKASPVYFQ